MSDDLGKLAYDALRETDPLFGYARSGRDYIYPPWHLLDAYVQHRYTRLGEAIAAWLIATNPARFIVVQSTPEPEDHLVIYATVMALIASFVALGILIGRFL